MKLNESMLNAVKSNKRNELKRLNQNGNFAGYILSQLGIHSQLIHTLENVSSINHKNVKDLYPQNYKEIIEESHMQLVGRIPR